MSVIELNSGNSVLRLAPHLGARITSLKLGSIDGGIVRELLAPFPEETRPEDLCRWPKGGIYPLVPYSNRIREGRLRFRNQVHDLPAHPDAAPHTLHGHAHRLPWTLAEHTQSTAVVAYRHEAGGEWPWSFSAALSLVLTEASLCIRLRVVNADPRPMPVGLGLHPYFAWGPEDEIQFVARTDWPVTPDQFAASSRPAANEFAGSGVIPAEGLTLYRSDWDGECWLVSAAGHRLCLRASAELGHVVVHRPAGAPYVCIEPTSHVADAFNRAEAGWSGTGHRVLASGQGLEAWITITNMA